MLETLVIETQSRHSSRAKVFYDHIRPSNNPLSQLCCLWRFLQIQSDIQFIIVAKSEEAGAVEAVNIVFVGRIMGTEAIQADSGFDMNHRRAVIGQVLADSRPGGEGGEFDDLDTF